MVLSAYIIVDLELYNQECIAWSLSSKISKPSYFCFHSCSLSYQSSFSHFIPPYMIDTSGIQALLLARTALSRHAKTMGYFSSWQAHLRKFR